MVTFESTITLGAIIQTIALLAAIISGWVRLNAKITEIETDVKSLQRASEGFGRALNQLSNILTQVAVQDNRMLNLEKRFDELSHGKGFIQ